MGASPPLGDLRKQISKETLDRFLEYFGITAGGNDDDKWTITFQTTATSEQTAYLDEESHTWKSTEDPGPEDDTKQSWILQSLESSNGLIGTTVYSVKDDHTFCFNVKLDEWFQTLPNNDFGRYFTGLNWDTTALGPPSRWSLSLRLYTQMVLADPRSSIIYWGTDRVAIYNESFVPLCGDRHSVFLGSKFRDTWPEFEETFEKMFQKIDTATTGFVIDEWEVFIKRNGYLEETWWVANVFPLKDEQRLDQNGGCYISWNEISRGVLSDRRTRLVEKIGRPLEQTVDGIWTHIYKVLQEFPRDCAMGILYSTETGLDDDSCQLERRGVIGLGTSSTAVPPTLDLNHTSDGFGPAMREAMRSQTEWLALDPNHESFPKDVLEEIEFQGYGEPSRIMVVLPLKVLSNFLKGFVILGLNPRVAWDADHKAFVSALSRQLKSLMTSITSIEQSKRREQHLMRKLEETEKRILKTAQLARVGMYDLAVGGKLQYANDHFFSILGVEPDLDNFDWGKVIVEEDQERATQAMIKSIMAAPEHVEIADTLRLKRMWKPPATPDANRNEEEEPRWILYQAYPDIVDGAVTSFMGCLTDISQLKWAETVQARSAEAAQVAKRRQEEFIDITSHEIRNPLSAVIQCANSISDSLADGQRAYGDADALFEILKSNVDAADTITLCSQHQKRILDDVLTLSKVDSALLTIAAVPFKPKSIVDELFSMFRPEFESNHISTTVIDDSPDVSGIEVACDPARLMQVLVNLVTNAIKFLREEQKEIIIRFGAANEPPQPEYLGVKWSSTNQIRKDWATIEGDYAEAEPVYLYFSCKDTGQGLPATEAIGVFDKFVQASRRRTKIRYGGSGLGLYISRELAELQGGHIGVSSDEGVGSTFAFYVKGRRIPPSLRLPPARVPSTQNPNVDPADLAQEQRIRRASVAQPTSSLGSQAALLQGPADDTDLSTIETSLLLQQPQAQAQQKQNTPTMTTTSPPKDNDDSNHPHPHNQHKSSKTQDLHPKQQRETPPPPSPPPISLPGAGLNLLIVEDNIVNQRVLANQLRKTGCTITVANHGAEAIEILLSTQQIQTQSQTQARPSSPNLPTGGSPHQPFTALLMDHQMPILDGLSATRRIRHLESTGEIKQRQVVIGVTANARKEQIEEAKGAGMDEVVVKPFRVMEIVEVVRGFVGMGQT